MALNTWRMVSCWADTLPTKSSESSRYTVFIVVTIKGGCYVLLSCIIITAASPAVSVRRRLWPRVTDW